MQHPPQTLRAILHLHALLEKVIRINQRYILPSVNHGRKDHLYKYLIFKDLVPYKYPPNLPIDVDYRVMSTFLDFYIVLLKFVLFKLYSSQNLQYPPSLKPTDDEAKY
jgi:hypothetical protein